LDGPRTLGRILSSRGPVEEALYFKECANTFYIRAMGHVTASLCSDLKNRVFERLEAKPPVENVFVDLSQCDYMDSTFLGLLVGINKRFLRFSERPITIVRPTVPCTELLKTIGILRLVRVTEEEIDFPSAMENVVTAEKATAEFLLDVHEDLIDLSDDNKKRFSTLYTVLKSQIDREEEE
jgi:anti-anti-sigma factor